MEMILRDLPDTQKLAAKLAKEVLTKGGLSVVALYGDLGTGKTTFVQCFARALGIKEKVLSPTFTIIKTFSLPKYNADLRMNANDADKRNLVHIDAYRLKSARDLLALGLKNILEDKENITIIEWPEKIERYLPRGTIKVYFEIISSRKRRVVIKSEIRNTKLETNSKL